MVARQRAYVRVDEQLGRAVVTAVTGHRDVAASGAQDQVTGWVGGSVDAQARAERRLALMAAPRSLSLGAGRLAAGAGAAAGRAVAGPRRGSAPGAVLGALVYVTRGAAAGPARLVQGVAAGACGSPSPWTGSCGPPPRRAPPRSPPPRPGRPAPGRIGLRRRCRCARVTFRYGPHADPVLDDLDLRCPSADHLAVVGASGIGKSTLAGLVAGAAASPVRDGPPGRRAGDRCGTPAGTGRRRRVLIPQEAYVFTGTAPRQPRLSVPRPPDRGGGPGGGPASACRAAGPGSVATSAAAPGGPVRGERQQLALLRAYLSPAATGDSRRGHLPPGPGNRGPAEHASPPAAEPWW